MASENIFLAAVAEGKCNVWHVHVSISLSLLILI